MKKVDKSSDDVLLGKKELSTEPAGFDLLKAAGAIGFTNHEVSELERLYGNERTSHAVDDDIQTSIKS